MIKKLLAAVLIWFCGFGNTVFAQKENNIWYFGNHAGLDFNSGSPVALTNSSMFAIEGCSSISDASGNLLFYTNGIKVWDRNHVEMPNGDSLDGGPSSTQAALIVPFPANSLMYYVFTTEDQTFVTHNFSYSVIDMSLNGGFGDVTIKNALLISPVTEKLTAVKHSNGNDIWVMTHGINNNSFYAYLVTTTSISGVPVTSNIGPVIVDTSNATNSLGQMKFSSNGAKIAFAAWAGLYVDLFDFDSSTGIVSNEKYLTLPPCDAYGLEFSQSGDYLYCTCSTNYHIFQWDITSNFASTINLTRQLVGTASTVYLSSLQLGPDGKIYSACAGSHKLGAINNPELPGILCNYIDSAVSLSSNSLHGLPNFITSYFLPTGINTNNQQQNQLTIYPNPTTDKITISFAATTNETVAIKIYSITGEVVYEKLFQSFKTLEKLNAIDVSKLSNGIYFLSVQTDEKLMTKKIVVNH
jgi:hypothetical protein